MLHEEKMKHSWNCDISKGDIQCPYVSRYMGGELNCVWKENHPDDLAHEAYYDQPLVADKKVWTLSCRHVTLNAIQRVNGGKYPDSYSEKIESLGLDSLEMLEVILEIEDRLELKIGNKDVDRLYKGTVDELIEFVQLATGRL